MAPEQPDFDLFDSIPLDASFTLDQLTSRFQTVRDGLPELVKNSKDQYAREKIRERSERQIVVLADSRTRSLAVIDFAGATAEEFDLWNKWSSRAAGRTDLASDIEAGYGNGGKAFMVRGSVRFSYMESYKGGRRTKMGFKNDQPDVRYRPGFDREGGEKIRDVRDSKPAKRLGEILDFFGLALNELPKPCGEAFFRREAFTAVVVEGVREWQGRRNVSATLPNIVASLRTHPQASLTIETSNVWVFVDGKMEEEPLAVTYPDPHPGFEALDPIPLPATLTDPTTAMSVDTGAKDPSIDVLQLRTSAHQLRLSAESALNIVRVHDERNIVGYWTVSDLAPAAASAYVMGEIRVPALDEDDLAGADRVGFSDTPRVRAVYAWIAEHVMELAGKIQEAQAHEERPQDKDRASHALDRFRDLMREYLKREFQGDETGDVDGPIGPEPPGHGWGDRIDEIALEPGRDRIAIAAGTTVPLVYHCTQVEPDGTRLGVKHPRMDLECDKPDGVEWDGKDQIRANKPGLFVISVVDPGSGKSSDEIFVEVIEATGATIVCPTEPMKRGERTQLQTLFETEVGTRDDILIDGYVDDWSKARLGRSGILSAGNEEATVALHVRWGPGPTDVVNGAVEIGPELIERKGKGAGADIPSILLCGMDAPGTEELPAAQRTVAPTEDYPSVHEEPALFPNVVWINTNSVESKQVRRRHGGSSGMMGIGTLTFTEFLALKCFDILKRLFVRQGAGEKLMTELEFTVAIELAETNCSDFIREAYELAAELAKEAR